MSDQEMGPSGHHNHPAPDTTASAASVPPSGATSFDNLQRSTGDCSDDRARRTPSEGAPPIGAPAAPQPLRWANLPPELQRREQWLVTGHASKAPYTYDPHNVPYRVIPASVTNPRQFMTFWQAAAVAQAFTPARGIGYVLTADDPFTCIDLDVKDSTTPEQIELFRRIAAGFDSYTERSMSGRGLHIWCRGKVGKGVRRDGVEVYSQERFIVSTGDVWIDRPIRHRQDYLDNMVSQMRALGTVPAALVELPPVESDVIVRPAPSLRRDRRRCSI